MSKHNHSQVERLLSAGMELRHGALREARLADEHRIQCPPDLRFSTRSPVCLEWDEYRVPRHLQGKPYEEWWDTHYRYGTITDRYLPEFLKLANATDEQVLDFAQKYGVLGAATTQVERLAYEGGYPVAKWVYQEPVEEYRRYARRFRHYLLGFADLLQGNKIRGEDCRIATDEDAPEGEPAAVESDRSTRDFTREDWTYFFSAWIEPIEFAPYLSWEAEDAPELKLYLKDRTAEWDQAERTRQIQEVQTSLALDDGLPDKGIYLPGFQTTQRHSVLLNVLLLQMVAAITSPFGLCRCDQCGDPFVPENRRPRADRRRLCSDDCRREAHLAVVRASNRRRQAREREEPS